MPSHAPTILLVDDEAEFLAVIQEAIESLGYRVIATVSPHAALEAIMSAKDTQPIDAVISDINMPKLQGIELLRRVRAARKEVPFVFLTGDSDREMVVEALRLGASDFLEKPIKRELLLETVKKVALLGMASRQAEVEMNRVMGLSNLPAEKATEFREAQRKTLLSKLKKLLD